MPSYERFVTLMPRVLDHLILLLQSLRSPGTTLSDIDSTALKVCHLKREKSNKVFTGFAQNSQFSMGWFFGFKLPLIATEKGETVSVKLTPGTRDDRFSARGLKLVTGIKKKMKNKLMDFQEKILLRKRSLSETLFDFLKNKFNLEHSRHQFPLNATASPSSSPLHSSLPNPPFTHPKNPLIHNARNSVVRMSHSRTDGSF